MWVCFAIFAVAIISPVAVYVYTFGKELSNDHSRWAEMGAAMSGIYSPLIALLALAVLSFQLVAQRYLNKHILDQ